MSLFEKLFNSSDNEKTISKIEWKQLTNMEQLNEIKAESNSKPVVIFKHSSRCIVSRMALKQFENEFDLKDKVTPYFLDLLEYRGVSNEIANCFEVEHQSPQLLLIRNGKSIYDVSHNSIDAEDLKRHI
jgi:bacillithiol system protein YtxJ